MWASESELLADLAGWRPLPDANDVRWESEEDGWADTLRLLGAADETGEQGWRQAAVAVFFHAASWDVYGWMQKIRHGPEKAFGEDDQEFASQLEPLTASDRVGTRLWTVRELGILRQLSSLPYLVARLSDENADVAQEAQDSIEMLAQAHSPALEVLAKQGGAR